jgi:hypothetical protein
LQQKQSTATKAAVDCLHFDGTQLHRFMKSIKILSSMLLMLSISLSGLQAQPACSLRPTTKFPGGSAAEQMAAYKFNFKHAVEVGNVQYSEIHRQKLVAFMDRVVVKARSEASMPVASAQPTDSLASIGPSLMAQAIRQAEIKGIIAAISIVDLSGIAIAKEKLCLVDEFEALMQNTIR